MRRTVTLLLASALGSGCMHHRIAMTNEQKCAADGLQFDGETSGNGPVCSRPKEPVLVCEVNARKQGAYAIKEWNESGIVGKNMLQVIGTICYVVPAIVMWQVWDAEKQTAIDLANEKEKEALKCSVAH